MFVNVNVITLATIPSFVIFRSFGLAHRAIAPLQQRPAATPRVRATTGSRIGDDGRLSAATASATAYPHPRRPVLPASASARSNPRAHGWSPSECANSRAMGRLARRERPVSTIRIGSWPQCSGPGSMISNVAYRRMRSKSARCRLGRFARVNAFGPDSTNDALACRPWPEFVGVAYCPDVLDPVACDVECDHRHGDPVLPSD
jgi:hypothetical protein